MEKRFIASLAGAALLMTASPTLAERKLAMSVHPNAVSATQQQRAVSGKNRVLRMLLLLIWMAVSLCRSASLMHNFPLRILVTQTSPVALLTIW